MPVVRLNYDRRVVFIRVLAKLRRALLSMPPEGTDGLQFVRVQTARGPVLPPGCEPFLRELGPRPFLTAFRVGEMLEGLSVFSRQHRTTHITPATTRWSWPSTRRPMRGRRESPSVSMCRHRPDSPCAGQEPPERNLCSSSTAEMTRTWQKSSPDIIPAFACSDIPAKARTDVGLLRDISALQSPAAARPAPIAARFDCGGVAVNDR